MRHVTFIEVDIRHRTATLWMLYSEIVTFMFKVRYFLVMDLLKKLCIESDCLPDRFASTRTAPAV